MSLNKAILDYIKGNKISDEEVENRLAICNECKFKGKVIEICKKCKCLLNGDLGKLKAPREQCPIGKWSAVKTEENG